MNWQIDNSNRTEFVYLNENYAKPRYLNFVKFSFGCCLLHKKAVQKTTRLYVWVKNNLCGKLLPMAAFWTYLMTLICPYRVVECTFSLAHFRHEYSLLYAILSRLRWNATYPDGSGGGCKHATGDYPFFVTPIDKNSLENCHHVTCGVDKSIKISIHVIC